MFRLPSEQSLLEAFRPKDRSRVELPPGLTFPLVVHHTLTWAHPAGGRVFLVFAVPRGVPTGIAFDTNGTGPAVPHMCDWCHQTGLGTGVSLLSARLDAKRTIGVHICSDLGCQRKLEDEADRSGGSPLPALEALVERMGRFARDGLKIDLTGAGR